MFASTSVGNERRNNMNSSTLLSDFRAAIEAEYKDFHDEFEKKILAYGKDTFENRQFMNGFRNVENAVLDFYIVQTDPKKIEDDFVFKMGAKQVAAKTLEILIKLTGK